MAIVRMINTRDPGAFREFQSKMVTVGKIRLGVYNGRYPEKIDTFRFTSEDEAKVRAAADAYGGTVEQWTPQGAKRPQWEVISQAKAIPVYIVNGQSLDPWYEAWAGGRTCVRRCDGVTNKITFDPCVCIPADGSAPTLAKKDLCKPTIRVQVMLAEIPGLGSWLMESHGENACAEISTFGPFVAAARTQIPAVLRLREEQRREWNPDKKGGAGFETKNFYVPWFDISQITMQQVAIGGDALTRALQSAGGSAALSADARQYAIEAPQAGAAAGSTPIAQSPQPAAPPQFDIDAKRPMILGDIEACTTVEALNGIRDKLVERGVDDQQVKEAWRSKMNAVEAADDLRARAAALHEADRHVLADAVEGLDAADRETLKAVVAGRPYRVLVTGSRTWTDVVKLSEQLDIAWMTHKSRMVLVHGKCPQGADLQADAWAKARGVPVEEYPANWNGPDGKGAGFKRNQAMVDSRPDIVLSFNRGGSKGTEHCTAAAEAAGLKVLRFTDDTPFEPQAPEHVPTGIPLKEYRVGDTVTVGGIEFTKISDNPFEPGSDAARVFTLGKAPCLNPYCAGTDTPCGFTPQQHMEVHGVEAIIEADRAAGLIPGEPVDGTVEGDASTLPMVPDGDHDAGELYTMLMTGASQQKPPLTTNEVNSLITRTFGLASAQHADGLQLARLRAGLKAGTVAWR